MKGIRVAKESRTVKDGTTEQYVDTSTPLFKLFQSDKGSISFSAASPSGGSPSIQILHDLGYMPMFFVYMDRTSNANRRLVISQDSSSGAGSIFVTVKADKKYIYIYISGTSVTGTFGYNYQIYYDKVGNG